MLAVRICLYTMLLSTGTDRGVTSEPGLCGLIWLCALLRSLLGHFSSHARSVTCFPYRALALNTYWQAVISTHTHIERATVTALHCPECRCCNIAVVGVDLMVLCTLLLRPTFPFSSLPMRGSWQGQGHVKELLSVIILFFLMRAMVLVFNYRIMFKRELYTRNNLLIILQLHMFYT